LITVGDTLAANLDIVSPRPIPELNHTSVHLCRYVGNRACPVSDQPEFVQIPGDAARSTAQIEHPAAARGHDMLSKCGQHRAVPDVRGEVVLEQAR
jgi:hypothetical protein